MATKAQVKRIAKQQGADFDEGYDSLGNYFAAVILPEHLDWDNGHGTGICEQTKGEDETMAEFWESMVLYIDYETIPHGR
jgi:hypothetical protein